MVSSIAVIEACRHSKILMYFRWTALAERIYFWPFSSSSCIRHSPDFLNPLVVGLYSNSLDSLRNHPEQSDIRDAGPALISECDFLCEAHTESDL